MVRTWIKYWIATPRAKRIEMSICKRGHTIEYTPGSDSCKHCKRDMYLLHRDKILAVRRAAYAENPEPFLRKNRVWAVENRDKVRAISRRHQKNHPESALANTRRQQLKKARAMPAWLNAGEVFEIEQIYAFAQVMNKITGTKHHVDHIVPITGRSVCGLHVPYNLQVIPATENIAKGNRLTI